MTHPSAYRPIDKDVFAGEDDLLEKRPLVAGVIGDSAV